MTITSNCGSCRFRKIGTSSCHRFPPVGFADPTAVHIGFVAEIVWLWSQVKDDDWCGEWELGEATDV